MFNHLREPRHWPNMFSVCVCVCVMCPLSAGLLTLCGVSLYIIYSYLALVETERLVGSEGLTYIHTSFGWSLGLAWLSYSLELLSGLLLLIAARMAKLQRSSPIMAWQQPPQQMQHIQDGDWTELYVNVRQRPIWYVAAWEQGKKQQLNILKALTKVELNMI